MSDNALFIFTFIAASSVGLANIIFACIDTPRAKMNLKRNFLIAYNTIMIILVFMAFKIIPDDWLLDGIIIIIISCASIPIYYTWDVSDKNKKGKL